MPSETRLGASQVNDVTVGTIDWTLGFADVFSDDDSFVNALLSDGETSHYLLVTDFGFTIPTGATIDGVTVLIGRKAGIDGPDYAEIKDAYVRLYRGAVAGDNKADTGTAWTTTETEITYGGSGDTWGLGWGGSSPNSSSFGVVIAVSGTGGIYPTYAEIDYVEVRVTYTEAAPTDYEPAVVGTLRRTVLVRPRPHSWVDPYLPSWDDASPGLPPDTYDGEWFVTARRPPPAPRGRSAILGPLTEEPPTASDVAFVEVISAQRRFAGARSRFVSASPSTSAIFTEPAFTESAWIEQFVIPVRPRGMHALRPLAYLVQVDLPAGNGPCECNPGGAVLVGFAYGAVLVSVTDYALGVGQYGATLVSQGFGRAVVVSVCEC